MLPDLITIDFETYSEAGYYWNGEKWATPEGFPSGKPGLPSIGAPRYAEHPSTEVLSLAYEGKLWRPGDPPPVDLLDYIKGGGLIEAHNSGFEFYIWHYVCHSRMGWPPLPLSQVRCDMAKGNAHGLPGALEKAAEVIGAGEQKDRTGKDLIRKLCCPRNPTKKNPALRLTPADSPDLFQKLYDYNLQDVRAEKAVSALVPELSPDELALWQLDQRINVRGVQIDTKGLQDCLSIVRQAISRYTAELANITAIPDITANKLQQLQGWLAGRGVVMRSMAADAVEAALKRGGLPDDARRVLEIRQALGSASVKKTYAIERAVSSDGRLRDLFQYYGARQTGRWAGRGPQPQNLPRGSFKPDELEGVLADIATRNLDHVESRHGDALGAVSGCLRALFCAAPGHDLICSDYSAIEAVVLAMIAGEQWRIDVFRTHGKIYEMSASKITGIPFDEYERHYQEHDSHHPTRNKVGKTGELASGFQGSLGAWKAFGAGEFMTDDEIKEAVKAWRAASPNVVKLWAGLEGAALAAIQNPGQCFQYNGIMYGVKGDVLYCRLLSGRMLTYHRPRLHNDVTPWGKAVIKITFDGWNSDSSKGPVGWMRRDTYGGKLTENVVQATARDILAHALIKADSAGYKVVLHVHDEIVAEVPQGWGSVEELESIMSDLPPWCKDWPVKASGGWRGKRYRK